MRYADLQFELHGYMSAADAADLRSRFTAPYVGEPTPVIVERAVAVFPSGRSVSILRGNRSAGGTVDFETARLHEGPLDPIKHDSIESVQAELDAVAALPPVDFS